MAQPTLNPTTTLESDVSNIEMMLIVILEAGTPPLESELVSLQVEVSLAAKRARAIQPQSVEIGTLIARLMEMAEAISKLINEIRKSRGAGDQSQERGRERGRG